jgi:hypothetical protein
MLNLGTSIQSPSERNWEGAEKQHKNVK